MNSQSFRQCRLFIIIVISSLIPCLIPGKSIAIHKKGQQRSYIDIDVTDPFKVPKASEYVDQPIPEYDSYGNRRREDNDHSINYKFDNIKIQTENKADVDEGPNHNEEEHEKYDDYHPGQDSHHFHNDMQEEGPEVPADQEESPRDVEPDSFPAHDEDEHMPGDSRHNVPKADWKPDDIEPLPDQRNHEESGAPWRSDDAPKNEDYRRHEYNERKFEENEEDKFNDDREREKDHFGGWERRGEDHGKDDAQQYMQHDGRHDGPRDGPHEALHFGPHEEPNEGSHEGPHNGLRELPHGGQRDWEHDGAREEDQRAEVSDGSSKENGKEGEYFDRES